ncbi:ArnT family glycosyltransferase [Mailhella sp.]|uniref:ArnT family glycosyltransferase n=1 Tax=Mailhella sp. TaxID=1981029 RepID=UPI0040628445
MKRLAAFLFALLVLLPLVYVFGTGIMEARNFISAQSMAVDGDWLVPHLFTEIRLNKPPLPVWLTTLVFLYDPAPSMLALHIPVILVTALLGVFCVDLHTRICGKGRASLYAGLVAVSMLMTIKLGVTNSWDIYSVVFMAGALVALLKEGRAWLIAGILCMAASVMSKGPVQLYTMLLPFLTASLIFRRPVAWKRLASIVGYGCLLGSLWYLFVYLTVPHEAASVAKGEVQAWSSRHLASFFFYLSFPIYAGAWMLPLLAALFGRWLKRSRKDEDEEYAPEERPVEDRTPFRFLLCWFLLSLLLLSLVPEKKERYLMPAFVPLAILTASALHHWTTGLLEGSLSRLEMLLVKTHLYGAMLASTGICLFIAWHNTDALLYVLPFAVLCLIIGGAGIQLPEHLVPVTCLLILCVVFAAWRGGSHRPIMQKTAPTCALEEFRTLPRLAGLPFYSLDGFGPIEEWEAGRDMTRVPSLEGIKENRFVLFASRQAKAAEFSGKGLNVSEEFLLQTSRGRYHKFFVLERNGAPAPQKN